MSAPPNTEPMLPDIMGQIPDPLPVPCAFPYFLAAYWPKDKRWKHHPRSYSSIDGVGCRHDIEALRNAGWTHITIMRLPEKLWKP